jgi:hypothetical protein
VAVDSVPFEAEGEQATWWIGGERLPERFWPGDEHADPHPGTMVALLYHVDADAAPGAFAHEEAEDQWDEPLALPCRTYLLRLSVKTGSSMSVAMNACLVRLGDSGSAIDAESKRYTARALASENVVEVTYPLQGATYSVHWDVFLPEVPHEGSPQIDEAHNEMDIRSLRRLLAPESHGARS